MYKCIFQYTEIKIKKDNIFKLVIGNKKLKLKGEIKSCLLFKFIFIYKSSKTYKLAIKRNLMTA